MKSFILDSLITEIGCKGTVFSDKKAYQRKFFSNILLNNAWDVKIADFGSARIMTNRDTKYEYLLNMSRDYTSKVTTLWYRAPEILLGERRYNWAIDMWAVGCLLAECLLNTQLFKGI